MPSQCPFSCRDHNFIVLQVVQVLDLDDNRIKEWRSIWTLGHLPTLKALHLGNNLLGNLEEIKPFASIVGTLLVIW